MAGPRIVGGCGGNGIPLATLWLMRYLSMTTSTICLACLLAATGCQQDLALMGPIDRRPLLDVDGRERSLALDTPLQHYIQTRQVDAGALPWYADRNDHSLAADAGYAGPTVQSSVTITRDRQYSSHGRVHDNFHSTTYRREYRQTVR